MPATDVNSSLLGPPGGFASACRPTDLIYFTINVGDGDTQLLLLPARPDGKRRCVLVDCIRANKLFGLLEALDRAGLLSETKPLFDLVVATHPHDDHIAGMAALLRRFGHGHIAELWEPGYYHPSAAYLEMMRELEDLDINLLQPAAGTTRYLGQVKITVLAPGIGLRNRFDTYGVNINNASIALKVDFPAARTYERGQDRAYIRLPTLQTLILGADAQTLSWSQVLIDFPQLGPVKTAVTTALRRARGVEPLRAQVFKVPHHGSKHGLNLELVEAIHPRVSIVSSVHDGGSYHFPHALTQGALREALDPISSKPEGAYRSDSDLNILYTGSNEVSDEEIVGPLGSVALLVGAGGRREVWRFGDARTASIVLAHGRPMVPPTAAGREPLPAVPGRHRAGRA
ncbi:MAG TPA: MBL fold metallo-hydrolase [Solirubrobacteraceae bacterium]|nr:MBL fold metallo-hydrolase [Solirubrobacteraceae bacterium]